MNRVTKSSAVIFALLVAACGPSVLITPADAGSGGSGGGESAGCQIFSEEGKEVRICIGVENVSSPEWPDKLEVKICRTATDGSTLEAADWGFRFRKVDMVVQEDYFFTIEKCDVVELIPDLAGNFTGLRMETYYRFDPTCHGTPWDLNAQADDPCKPLLVEAEIVPPVK